ncbi:hypothetical protein CVT26_006465 [Gymnopilus dilepis]|uniref:Electron transfer flavoprotein-ubiquinone oxidoreductase n=1 Tax=Gymnopilus dilepis TaxID=231916 RepID=A0A409YTV7_9AGAR|nr:hypothetical protein CVT26_006465 [Gymnopilus dilepis]
MKSGMLAAEAAFGVVHPDAAAASESDASPASETAEKQDGPADMSPYTHALHSSWVHKDLWEVRNMRPSFSTPLGIWGGIAYSGAESLIRGMVPWTFKHHSVPAPGYAGVGARIGVEGKEKDFPISSLDAHSTSPASAHKPPHYPPFEPPLSTDLLTSVALTGTNHAEDQPVHLRVVRTGKYVHEVVDRALAEGGRANVAIGGGTEGVRNVASALAEGEEGGVGKEGQGKEEVDRAVKEEAHTRREHVRVNTEVYAGLLGRACPAAVYEYVDVEGEEGKEGAEGQGRGEDGTWKGKKLVINSQNCIHCKLCDVKVPTQDITWTVPEGGGGPKYSE